MVTRTGTRAKGNENDTNLAYAVAILQRIVGSYQVHLDTRETVGKSMAALEDPKQGVSVREANATSAFDELAQGTRIPSFARVRLWTELSKLEPASNQQLCSRESLRYSAGAGSFPNRQATGWDQNSS
jgi:uncharacterized protein (UPF0147 family)